MKLFVLEVVSLNKTCNKARIGKYLSRVYPIKFGLKKEDAFSLFYFSRVLFYVIWENKEKKEI